VDPSVPDWITAIATAGAAVGTVGALLFAARAAKAANHSAEAAHRAIAEASRPLLLDVPYEHYTDHEHEYPWPGESPRKTPMRGQILFDPTHGVFVFPIRNVGRGAARIQSFSATLSEADVTYAEYSGAAVPAGEDAWLAARPDPNDPFVEALRRVPSPLHGVMPVIFTVTYTDIAGNQEQRLELGVGSIGQDSALRVIRIEHIALDS
jgi:hypothetical protein